MDGQRASWILKQFDLLTRKRQADCTVACLSYVRTKFFYTEASEHTFAVTVSYAIVVLCWAQGSGKALGVAFFLFGERIRRRELRKIFLKLLEAISLPSDVQSSGPFKFVTQTWKLSAWLTIMPLSLNFRSHVFFQNAILPFSLRVSDILVICLHSGFLYYITQRLSLPLANH